MKRIGSFVTALCLLLCLSGCGDSFFDTMHYKLPKEETEKAEQNLAVKSITELARPTTLVYVEDGKAKYFKDGEEAFDRLLALNEARDTGTERKTSSYYDAVDESFYRKGRYLFYRYEDGSYRDVVFSLVRAADETDSDYSTTIWFNQENTAFGDNYCSGSYGILGPADELLDYIDSLK